MTIEADTRQDQTAPRAEDAAWSLGTWSALAVPLVQPDGARAGQSRRNSVNLGEKTAGLTWSPSVLLSLQRD